MKNNQNDNRAPQLPLRSNWAGQKSPISSGCRTPLKGESRFVSRDRNFSRTVNDNAAIRQIRWEAKERVKRAKQRVKAAGLLRRGGVRVPEGVKLGAVLVKI
jgi:hypothetical protein